MNFSVNDWYFLRKIHKKESNFFLNKGGQRGTSGGGWLSHQTKSTGSNCADEEVKFITLKEKKKQKKRLTPNQNKECSSSELSSQHSGIS